MVERSRREGGLGRKGPIATLFVGSLPEKLHWSGLRHASRRHGDLMDSYIAKKVNRDEKRFGFVRFSNRTYANRAIERLHGFKLYGYKLSVSFAKFNTRTSFWRRKKKAKDFNWETRRRSGIDRPQYRSTKQEMKYIEAKVWKDKSELEEKEEQVLKQIRRIEGHIDNENLWKLGKCLVGTMAIVCSADTKEETKSSSSSVIVQSWKYKDRRGEQSEGVDLEEVNALENDANDPGKINSLNCGIRRFNRSESA
ncbi:hypothetical protein GQ457_15G021230 [Hibiscus cannabinus]